MGQGLNLRLRLRTLGSAHKASRVPEGGMLRAGGVSQGLLHVSQATAGGMSQL